MSEHELEHEHDRESGSLIESDLGGAGGRWGQLTADGPRESSSRRRTLLMAK